MASVVEVLEQLGGIMAECRKIPSKGFREYGEQANAKLAQTNYEDRIFEHLNPHCKGTSCHDEWERNEYTLYSSVCWVHYNEKKRGRWYKKSFIHKKGKEPIFASRYVLFRDNRAEKIERKTYSKISDLEHTKSPTANPGNDVLYVSQYVDFAEHAELFPLEQDYKGVLKGNKKIVPALPLDEAQKLVELFSGLLEYHRSGKVAVAPQA